MSPGQGDQELCRARHTVRFKSHCSKVTSPRVFRGCERRACAPPLGSELPPGIPPPPGPLSLQVPLQLCPQSSYTPLPYLHYPYTSFLLVPQLLSPLYMQRNPYPGSLPPPPWERNRKNGCSQGPCRAGGNATSAPTGQWRGVRVARRVTAFSQPGLCLRPSGHPSFSDLL